MEDAFELSHKNNLPLTRLYVGTVQGRSMAEQMQLGIIYRVFKKNKRSISVVTVLPSIKVLANRVLAPLLKHTLTS